MPRLKSFLPAFTATLFLLASAAPAMALDMDFYTYGGFGPVTQAFQKVALVFSDPNFRGLFFTITVLGIFGAGASWVIKFAMRGNAIPLQWTVPVMLGVVVYLGLFIPQGNITVFDPALNRFQTIGGIPVGAVFIAGTLNTIERGVVEIIDTAGAPGARFREGAGGIGFNLIKAASYITPKNAHVKASLARYIEDCVSFELLRPGTNLSLDDLRNNTTDFIPEFEKAVNPMIWTMYFDDSTPAGQAKTCTDAWNSIKPIINDPNFYTNAVKAMCGKGNFNPANAAELAACKDLATNTLTVTTGLTVTPENLLKQTYLSNMLYNFYYASDHELSVIMQANRQITTSGIGMGITMNAWVPVMRAVMTAVAIGLIPFLVLFLPTPLAGKTLSAMAGFFVFIATWGVTDAVLHGAAMDHAVEVYEDIRQSGMGVYTCVAFPEASTKIQAMFGIIRSSGIMLASFLTMMLIKFGGHALAMMAGSLQGTVQGAGSNAGRMLTPEGQTHEMHQQIQTSKLQKAWASMDEDRMNGMVSRGSFDAFSTAGAWRERGNVAQAERQMDALGAARNSGLIQPEGSPESQMGALYAQHNIGTGDGMARVTLGNGQGIAMVDLKNMKNGWATTYSKGSDGQQRVDAVSASGKYGIGPDGNVAHAGTAVGVGMDLTSGVESRLQEKGANSLTSNVGYNRIMSQVRQDSTSDSRAQSFQEQVRNLEQEKLSNKIGESSAFSQVKSEETGQTAKAFAQAGGNFLGVVKGGVGYELRGTSKDGKTVNFGVNEEQARMFEEQHMKIRTETMTESLQNSRNLSYAANLAKNVGATESSSYLKEALDIRSDKATAGVKMETAFLKDYVDKELGNQGGSAVPRNMEIGINHINALASNASEIPRLQALQREWLDGKWGNAPVVSQPAREQISQTLEQVTGESETLRGQVEPVATKASDRTSGITEGSLHAPSRMGTLHSPGPGSTNAAARAEIRGRNLTEMEGNGSINETPFGIVSDRVGHLVAGKPDPSALQVPNVLNKPSPPNARVESAPGTFEQSLHRENTQAGRDTGIAPDMVVSHNLHPVKAEEDTKKK